MRQMGLLLAAAAMALMPNSVSADTTYKYDTLGRLACVAYGNGNVIIYNYDPAGNRTSVVVQGTACP
jgi:predicted site-specific integrase-resolvase